MSKLTKNKLVFTLDDLVQAIAGITVQPKDGILDYLDAVYDNAKSSSISSIDDILDENMIKIETDTVEIVPESKADANAVGRFTEQRKHLGIDEQHPNVLLVDVLLVHSDKAVNNWGNDIIPMEEAKKALPSLMLQPMDVSPLFDRHMRERLYDGNGIRGVIYASELAGDELWIGVVIWARDFPEIAEAIIRDAPILGSSFDLVFARGADNENGSRSLFDIKFLGGTILYKTRAADSETKIGSISYMGADINGPSEGSIEPMESNNTQANESAVVVMAQETIAKQMETIAELQKQVKELKSEKETVSSELLTTKDTLAEVMVKINALENEKIVAERREVRMGELDNIKMAFTSDDERSEIISGIGAMNEEEYSTYKMNVTLSASMRREAVLEQLLADASAQITQLSSDTLAASSIHNGPEDSIVTEDADHNGSGPNPHNGPDGVTESTAGESVARAGSFSSVNTPAVMKTPEDAENIRKKGRNMAALLSGITS